MKNILFRPVLLIVLMMITIVSCKDDEASPNRTSMLTSGEWKVTKLIADGNDITSALSGKSYRFHFKADGTYTESLDQNSGSGKWKFTNNEQQIIFDEGTSDEYTAEVLVLTASNLNIRFQETDQQSGDSYTIEVHMTH